MYDKRPNRSESNNKAMVLICLSIALAIIAIIPFTLSLAFNKNYDKLAGEIKNLSVSVELLKSEIKDLKDQVNEIEIKTNLTENEIAAASHILYIRDAEDYSNEVVDETSNVVYDTFDGLAPIPADTPISELQTNWIPGMDYRTITNHRSEQWAMQLQSTTNEYGARVYNGYICSAMANFYTHTVGDTFHVILNNGSEFDVICGDFKDDGTDPLFRGQRCRNYDEEEAISVLEFIMDTPELPYNVAQAGIFNALPFYGGIYGDGGNIISLEKTGHLDVDMSVLDI